MSEENTGYVGAIVLLAFCGVCSFIAWQWYIWEAPFEGEIIGISWDYAQEIEEYQAVGHQCESQGCYPEYSYNRSVYSTSTKSTTSTHYLYTSNDWVVISTRHATGQRNSVQPYYPSLRLSTCEPELEPYGADSPMLGCQREGRQIPRHYILISFNGLQDTCDIPFGSWSELSVGDGVSGEYYSNRNQIMCSSIKVGG